jgi:hypothetical protein
MSARLKRLTGAVRAFLARRSWVVMILLALLFAAFVVAGVRKNQVADVWRNAIGDCFS